MSRKEEFTPPNYSNTGMIKRKMFWWEKFSRNKNFDFWKKLERERSSGVNLWCIKKKTLIYTNRNFLIEYMFYKVLQILFSIKKTTSFPLFLDASFRNPDCFKVSMKFLTIFYWGLVGPNRAPENVPRFFWSWAPAGPSVPPDIVLQFRKKKK